MPEVVGVVDAVVHKEVGVADEGIANASVRSVHEARILLHFRGVQAVQARDRIIYLANIDALNVVRLPLLTTQTALVNTLSDVSVAKLAVHRLNEAELAPPSADIHLHRVLLRAIHHGVVR